MDRVTGVWVSLGTAFWAPVFVAHLGPHFGVRSLIHFSKMGPIVAYSLSQCFLMDLATIAKMAARYLADSAQAESNAKRKVVSWHATVTLLQCFVTRRFRSAALENQFAEQACDQ